LPSVQPDPTIARAFDRQRLAFDRQRLAFDRQRLAFGRVAELYDRARPPLPEVAIESVLRAGSLRARDRIVEVGAGPGRVTARLAERGLRVVALEPSPEMARLARANCARHPGVEVLETEFERWTAPFRARAIVSAQAWHWISPQLRYPLAAAALAAGGLLAAIWTFPDWEGCTLRADLSRIYRELEPALEPDFPMHPDSVPARLAGDWRSEIADSGHFAGAAVSTHPWSLDYSGRAYADLLATHQDHILLAANRRAALLAAIADEIDRAGGLSMPFQTHVCIAFRSGEPARQTPARVQTGG
jgi:SAM-dependent methyltransferase